MQQHLPCGFSEHRRSENFASATPVGEDYASPRDEQISRTGLLRARKLLSHIVQADGSAQKGKKPPRIADVPLIQLAAV
jgi:hypothetical protein